MPVRSVDVFHKTLAGTGRKQLVTATVDEVQWVLNQAGGAKIQFDPLSPDAELIELSACELEVWINESLADGHCVVPRGVSGNTDRITFESEGLLSYFEYAYVAEDSGAVPAETALLQYTAQEQMDIAASVIDWVQARPNSDRRIETALYTPSGVLRSKNFYRDAYENVFDFLQEFPKLHLGFDFDVKLFNDGRREFVPYYPSKGSVKNSYHLQLDRWGRKYVEGIEDWKETTLNQATEVYNTGGTVTQDNPDPTPDTQLKVVGRFEDTTADGSPKYGRLTRVISSGQMIDLGWLNDRAREEELLFGEVVTSISLAVSSDLFGLITTGDVLPVTIDYGRLRVNGYHRIMAITWRGGPQNLLLSLQPAIV